MHTFFPPTLLFALREIHDALACGLFAAALILLAIAFGDAT